MDAHIMPPTAQNQKTIESDLCAYVPPRANLPVNELRWQCEQAIRNYDPVHLVLDTLYNLTDGCQ
jgi:sulfhydrogenase subunit alpha